MIDLEEKLQKLESILLSYGTVAVAFSGGVDSSLLLDVAHQVLGNNCLAVSVCSKTFPERERVLAAQFCKQRGIEQFEVLLDELEIPGFAENPPNRCYLCKKVTFGEIITVAANHNMAVIADGSNTDDEGDYRPGLRALLELKVSSPLREAGINKCDVRALAKQRGITAWDKPSSACLASRLPYGTKITAELLKRIDKAEQYLLDMGFALVRVRVHENIARIETDATGLELLLSRDTRDNVERELKQLGFLYVTADLGGYRTGSLNAELPDSSE
jgi:uncharacterized protein